MSSYFSPSKNVNEGWLIALVIGGDDPLLRFASLEGRRQRLEVDAEVRFHNLAARAFRIAKHQIVLHWMTHGSWKVEINRLIVRCLDVKQSLARTVAGKICLLLLIQDKEIDVRGVVCRTVKLAGKDPSAQVTENLTLEFRCD